MFFPDLFQRFLPINVMPDRAEYLEKAWEVAWTDHCSKDGVACADKHLLGRNFLDFWPANSRRWIPILVIGGAREEIGRRILTSNVAFGSNQIDADDFHAAVQGDVSMSTAMLNGARFPYVSPGGTLPCATGGHILDGGYFDAAGIETMREAATTVLQPQFIANALHDFPGTKLTPVFILLENGAQSDTSNSTAVHAGAAWSHPVAPSKAPQAIPVYSWQAMSGTQRFAEDLVGPAIGLYSSRDAHAAHLREILENPAPPVSHYLYEIRVCHAKHPQPPLDWVLSEYIKKWMRQEVEKGQEGACDNVKAIEGITDLVTK